jgi:hypothetical protein
MPDSQQQINYGNSANDGTGDPLRTAFIKVDDNFDAVWNAGPVGSNITVLNNTISTVNVNGNLVLSPNGIGMVLVSGTISPALTRSYDLGTTNLRWRNIYANTLTANNITYNGNVFTGNLEGNVLYADSETLLINNVTGAITANSAVLTGNVTAQYFIGDGSLLTGLPEGYANTDAVAYAESGWAGNIVPAADNTYSLGNATNQWSDLYVSNATIYMNNVPLSLSAGNVLTINGEPVLSNDSNTAITTTGNITATYFIGDGSLLTGIAAGTGNITFSDTTMSPPDGVDITISAANSEVIIEAFDIRLDATDDLRLTGNDIVSLRNRSTTDPVTIITDYDDSETTWEFGVDGTLTTPGDIVVAGDITGTAGANTLVLKAQPASNTLIQLNSIVDSVISTVANLEIRTDVSGTAQTWTFGTDGVLTAPGDVTTTGNISAGNVSAPNFLGNISAANVVGTVATATTAGTVTTAAQPNITSVGALSSLSVTGNITGGNISTGVITLTNGAVIRDTAGDAVAIGQQAGETSQGNYAVAMGFQAAITSQGIGAVAIGREAGNAQGAYAVAIGQEAGFAGQSSGAIAIGLEAGNNDQGGDSVAIGYRAGGENQDIYAVAIGYQAGNNTQGGSAVAIGEMAGTDTQGVSAVAVGDGAGRITQGEYAVALGYGAGDTNQGNNSIIINATGANLDQTTANTFTVAPVRNDVANVAEVMFYNTTSKEITYGNVISVTGNITADYFIGNGSQLTGLPAQYGDTNVATFLAAYGSNTLSTTGNITAGNLIGNISITGNVTGTSSNVELVAGSYSYVFDNTGNTAFANGTVSLTDLSATGNITGNTAGFAIGYRDIPQVTFTGNVTMAAADAGKHYYSTQSANYILTIANNTSVGWSVGTAITVVNRGTGNMTIAQGSGVSLYLAGNNTAGNRTVTTYGMATVLNVAANVWMINGTGVS